MRERDSVRERERERETERERVGERERERERVGERERERETEQDIESVCAGVCVRMHTRVSEDNLTVIVTRMCRRNSA